MASVDRVVFGSLQFQDLSYVGVEPLFVIPADTVNGANQQELQTTDSTSVTSDALNEVAESFDGIEERHRYIGVLLYSAAGIGVAAALLGILLITRATRIQHMTESQSANDPSVISTNEGVRGLPFVDSGHK